MPARMQQRARLCLVVTVALLAAGCTQSLPGQGEDGLANAWAHEAVQADQMRKRGLSGQGVSLAVVDTGVGAEHPAFGNISVMWRDFVNGQKAPYDDHGHGTHVSSLALARGTSSFTGPNIKGIAPGAEMINAKAIKGNGEGGDAGDVADAIDWSVRKGADVLVLSLGQRPSLLPIGNQVEDAVSRALDEGVVVVAAAGNAGEGESGEDCSVSSPATIPLVIAVGAIDQEGQIAKFSCKGSQSRGPAGLMQREDPNKKPELTAPGVKLVGAWPGRPCGQQPADYCVSSGTSQATPIVGAIVAMLLEENPDLARQDRDTIRHIKRSLAQTAEKVGFNGHHSRYGYGVVQGSAALTWLEQNEMESGGGPLPPPPVPSGPAGSR